MSRDANIAAQEHLAELINAGEIDRLDEVFADAANDHDPAPGQGPGADGFKTFFNGLRAGFSDLHIAGEHVVADDDNVAIAYTVTGTHDGEFQGVAPTGNKIEIRGVQIGRFEGGKLVERWGSSDELGLMAQIGAVPQTA
jgi:predicted ester cyclase